MLKCPSLHVAVVKVPHITDFKVLLLVVLGGSFNYLQFLH